MQHAARVRIDGSALDGGAAEAGRRATAAAVIGNVLEWYDFAVYGFMAASIGKQFFPGTDELASLLATYAAFGVGFVVRPLGGILIGRYGDLRGRKAALLLTIFLMAGGTVLIGVLPGYAVIGLAAPVLLVLARLMQGFSAGGEWGGSTAFIVEWAPQNQRGWYGSFQQASVGGGLLLGSAVGALVSTLLSPATLDDWGWRVPFLLGGILGPIGLWMRRSVAETPAFVEAVQQGVASGAAPVPEEATPFVLAAKAFGFTILWTVSYYIALTYMPTFTQRYAGLSRSEALWANTICLVALVVLVPVMGRLSDRVGRKPLLLGCCLGFAVLTYPLFRVLVGTPGTPAGPVPGSASGAGASFLVVALVQVTFAAMIALFSGPGPAAIAEIFPTRSRSTWMSAGYALAVAVFGGFAPFIATWLIGATGSPLAPTYYVIAAALASFAVIWTLRETAFERLR